MRVSSLTTIHVKLAEPHAHEMTTNTNAHPIVVHAFSVPIFVRQLDGSIGCGDASSALHASMDVITTKVPLIT